MSYWLLRWTNLRPCTMHKLLEPRLEPTKILLLEDLHLSLAVTLNKQDRSLIKEEAKTKWLRRF